MSPKPVKFYGICYWGSILKFVGRFNFHLYLFNITPILSKVQFEHIFKNKKIIIIYLCTWYNMFSILRTTRKMVVASVVYGIFNVRNDVFFTVVREHEEVRGMQSTHFDITCSLAEVRLSFCFSVGVY
jgi:hypothetical protein